MTAREKAAEDQAAASVRRPEGMCDARYRKTDRLLGEASYAGSSSCARSIICRGMWAEAIPGGRGSCHSVIHPVGEILGAGAQPPRPSYPPKPTPAVAEIRS